jgi:hypothetical protein
MHPDTQSLLAHGTHGGDPVQVPRRLRGRLFVEAGGLCHLAQHLLVAQILPRDEEDVVRRLAVRSAASSFFGEGVERQGERGAGLVGGDVDLDPVVLGEPVDVVAPVVADVLAARCGQRRRGRPD